MAGLGRFLRLLLWLAALVIAWARRRSLMAAGSRAVNRLFGPAPEPAPSPQITADVPAGDADPATVAEPGAVADASGAAAMPSESTADDQGEESPATPASEESAAIAAGLDGSAPGNGTRDCPEGFPVKGNADSMIYHEPGQPSYAATIAEVCFASAAAAEAAGFRAPRRGTAASPPV